MMKLAHYRELEDQADLTLVSGAKECTAGSSDCTSRCKTRYT